MKRIIKCGTLFDATGSEPMRQKSIVIDGDRIEAVISSDDAAKKPEYARLEVIDASKHWVMPGLINVHDHMIFRDLIGNPVLNMQAPRSKLALNSVRNHLVALRRGWTTVRDMGASDNLSFEFRDYLARGDIPGPRVIACGAPICITGGHANGVCVEADGPYEVRKAARGQLEGGADFIKVMASHDPIIIDGPEKTRPEMNVDEIEAAYEQARAHGKRTACHVMGTVAIGRVLDAGVNVISHGFYLNDELAHRMVEQNVYLDPTLSSYGRQTISPKLNRGEAWKEHHLPLIPPMESAFRAAVKAGVKIVTGTDSAGLYAEDVAMMREFGLAPKESLLACTRYAAEALGLAQSIGTIEAGKIADIVVLDGDPMKDAYDLDKVHLVIQGGKPLKPAEITLESLV